MMFIGIASPVGFLPCLSLVNVLYIDWEADGQTHKRYIKAIKRGLIEAGVTIPVEHKPIS